MKTFKTFDGLPESNGDQGFRKAAPHDWLGPLMVTLVFIECTHGKARRGPELRLYISHRILIDIDQRPRLRYSLYFEHELPRPGPPQLIAKNLMIRGIRGRTI